MVPILEVINLEFFKLLFIELPKTYVLLFEACFCARSNFLTNTRTEQNFSFGLGVPHDFSPSCEPELVVYP